MTYSEFMNRPKRLHQRIMHKADEVELKFTICTKTTSALGERVQISPSNATERNYVTYIEAKNALDRLMCEYDEAVNVVKDFIYKNLTFDEADLLEWRYINDKSLQEISDKTGYAYKTVRNKMSKAERKARKAFNS